MAIRGGGHSVAGHSICSGGLLIDLRLMGGVLTDPESRRARVGGGATWRSVDACSAMHRLAMPGGTFDTTGVAGLTLGGGIGHLIGLHGLTLDNLESAEVVLADGTVVTASNTVEPELFWALRGGRELRRRDRIRVQAAPIADCLGRDHHLCAASGGGRRPPFPRRDGHRARRV